MRIVMTTLIAAGLMICSIGSANAADGKGPEGKGKRDSQKGRADFQKKMLEKFDKNGDGQLSADEKEAAKAAFEARKGGKPGEKGFNGKGGRGKDFGGKGREAMMKKFDTNSDGKLDETEKAAAKEAFQKRREEKKE